MRKNAREMFVVLEQELAERQLSSKEIFDGRILHVFEDTVSLPNGKSASREYLRHIGAVCIVPVLENGDVLVERQYRYPVAQVLTEIPAGKLDGGEDPDTCAARELTEETGYKTEHMEKLGYVYTTPGFCNETIHLYLADHLVKSHQHLDRDEFLDVIRLPIDKVYEMVDRGEIYDAKTLAALAMARKKLEMRN